MDTFEQRKEEVYSTILNKDKIDKKEYFISNSLSPKKASILVKIRSKGQKTYKKKFCHSKPKNSSEPSDWMPLAFF